MTQESITAIKAAKTANIISCLCELYGVSIQIATDIYYTSVTAEMIEEGIADLHCRSDKYLASLIWEEYQDSKQQK